MYSFPSRPSGKSRCTLQHSAALCIRGFFYGKEYLDSEFSCNYSAVPVRYQVPQNGEEILEGKSPDEIVDGLSELQWPDKAGRTPREEYMREASARAKAQKGTVVRSCCSQHFLEDLEKAGSIRPIEGENR